jgi:hypothetical protein
MLTFSDDDGDLECDEETRIQANIRTETGMRLVVLGSAATNVWFDDERFSECNERYLEPATRGAGIADGSALDVVGTGVVTLVCRDGFCATSASGLCELCLRGS